MRRLILLRHAHAESPTQGQGDAERVLSSEGQAEAEAVGRWMHEHGLKPDCVLCSPSLRTRQTLEAVIAQIGHVPQREAPEIYEATPGTLMELIDRHREIGTLMLVGHNPGFEQLVALLESGQTTEYRGMPPAGVAVISVPPEATLEPGIGTLVQFWWP